MLYFDNASTTKISKESLESYIKASELFYNPSALYGNSMESYKEIDNARKFFLKFLNAKSNSTVIFTGSASESNNSVLHSVITRKDKKYIFSAGEHSSIYETAKAYKEQGYNIEFIPLNKNGSVDTDKLYETVDDSTALVSIIHVSNETGAINDIKEITKRIREKNKTCLIHSDGVQALGKVNIDLKALDIDFYTLSAHKINGPKGIGLLYISNPSKFKPFVLGGGQEMGLRAGTENLPQISAFRTAVEHSVKIDLKPQKTAIISHLMGDFVLVSDDNCVDNIISVCFKGVRGETILHMLEEKGFLIGTGSACNSKAGHNRVLSNIVSRDYIEGAIRLSFGAEISVDDCLKLAECLNDAVKTYIERIKR